MKKILLMLAIMLFPKSDIFAAKVAGLYQAEITVISQLSDVRTKAARQGLLEVLMKVSGNPEVETNPYLQDSLKRAEYFVQAYSYATSSTSSAYVLKIYFSPFDVKRLLRQAGIAFWGENRPLILTWISIKHKNNATEVVGYDTGLDLLNKVKTEARRFGLPIIFPIMDVTDVDDINPADVTSFNLSNLKKTNDRYGADAVLIGNIIERDNESDSRWLLALGDKQWTWTISSSDQFNLVASALDQVSRALAKHYLIKTDQPNLAWFTLTVNNVKTRKDLAKLLNYFNKMNQVQEAELSQVKGEIVEIAVQIKGPLANFLQNALLNHHLELKSQDEKNNKLVYDWIR